MSICESHLEEVAISWLTGLEYSHAFGPHIAPDESAAERASFSDIILIGRLYAAIGRLNSELSKEAVEEVIRKVTRTEHPALIQNNHRFHDLLVNGVPVETKIDGQYRHRTARLIDFDNPEQDDWLAVNQFTVIEDQHNRRPDIVIFVNGLPLAVIELKNPADEDATIWTAFNQIQTYKHQIPSLFVYNEVVIISDGLEARIGSLTSNRERFMPWRTIEGDDTAPTSKLQLEVLIKGVFDKRRFLDLIRHFIVFETESNGTVSKKIAGYHQFHAVNSAINSTIEATRTTGDKRCGVVWHTQGSGKSLTMAFYAGKAILHPAMENPTLVVITDRNDLDDQLFGTFSRCHELLRQKPVQAQDRADLQKLLQVASGGVIFTTIHKFFPEEKGGNYPLLSERRNIVVIADEAHRSQYDFIDGFARHMRDALPNASFIGFTGTPIELQDRNTRAVFGDYISIYDIQQAVYDGATVKIYYESRLAQLDLNENEKPKLDVEFEEVTEGEELSHKERLKTKWAALEAVVGTEKRINMIAEDLVKHFEARCNTLFGKGLIVCMSRRICVEMYKAITRLRPQWHDNDDQRGAIKVVMTGSATDSVEWQDHIRNKPRREKLADRFRNHDDPLKLVLVRDMWLTGFDVPCLHTMYVDKPMRGHGLMQAIARVNRVFRDKPGGLVVDYLGLADQLKKALANYTQSGGKGETTIDQEEAVAIMLEKYEICFDLFHGFDWSIWTSGTPEQRIGLLPPAQEHILRQENGKERLLKAVTELSQAFALSVPHRETFRIRDDVGFFQAVRSALAKTSVGPPISGSELEFAVRQLVSKAISAEGVIDVFAAAGLSKPDISILSDEFLAEVKELPHRNLAVELLEKLLRDEIRNRSKKYLVQARSFAEMLDKTIKAYHNRAIETAQIIEELIALAREMREANQRGEQLGLSEEELAFYDALEVNDSAVKVLGEETLRQIARELVDTVRRNVTIDWTVKESVRAKLRTLVKRLLRKHGYPPDKEQKATETVLEQAELIGKDWAA
jgi:type I restriction enzyme R subunit